MFVRKKGSLVLSMVASGAVAATIVAAHKITQNFAAGSGQGWGYQEAQRLGQKALSLASLMVSRNIVLCSDEILGNGNYRGCIGVSGVSGVADFSIDPDTVDTESKDFYDKLHIDDDKLTSENGVTTLELKRVNSDSPFYALSRSSSNNNWAKITWSLRSWKKDPAVRTIFSSTSGSYVCRNTDDHSIVANGVCEKMDSKKGLSQIYKDDDPSGKLTINKCKDKNGDDIESTACDYVFVSDNDGQMVFISVEVPYSESSEQEVVSTKTLTVNGAIRRPAAMLKVMNNGGSSVTCSIRCEANGDGGLNLNDNPQCVGLSSYGANEDGDNKYDPDAQLTGNSFLVKNDGPGVLYDLKFVREDFETNTYRQLFKATVEPTIAGGIVRPEGDVLVEDKIPCYISSYYQANVTSINCKCSMQRIFGESETAFNDRARIECEKFAPGETSRVVGQPVRVLENQKAAVLESLQSVNSSVTEVIDCGGSDGFIVVPQLCSLDGSLPPRADLCNSDSPLRPTIPPTPPTVSPNTPPPGRLSPPVNLDRSCIVWNNDRGRAEYRCQ